MSMTLTTTLNLTKKGIDKVINTVPEDRENQYEVLFSKEKTRSRNFEVNAVTGFGFGTQTNEGAQIAYDTRNKLWQPTYVPLKYVQAFQHTVEVEFQDIYSEIMKDAGLVRDALFETREKTFANILNNGFTGTSGPDSLSLFHATHTTNGGTTYSNTTASLALNAVNLKQARYELRRQKDPRNMARKVRGPMVLVVPPELETDAQVIVQSNLLPGSGDNDKNVIAHGVGVQTMDYLTDVNNWFVAMKDKKRHSLFGVDRMPLTTKMQADIDTLSTKFAVYEEYVPGWVHGYGIWGSAV